MEGDLHDFENYRWRQPLVRPERGRWRTVGGPIPQGYAVNIFLPRILGIPTNGQTLRVNVGIWTQNPTLFAYLWFRNGVAIDGSQSNTSNAYTLTEADVGTTITVMVWAANSLNYILDNNRFPILDSNGQPLCDTNGFPVISAGVGPIAEVLSISGTPVTTATHGTPYAGFTVSGGGGWPPYIYNVTSGLWPVGITMSGRTGIVAGTPRFAGTSANIVITVYDLYGLTASLPPFTITVS